MNSYSQEKPVVTGYFSESQFHENPPFDLASTMELNENDLKKLGKQDDVIDVKVFFGSWCEDSEVWIPAFLKLRDHLHIDKLEFIGLDRSKIDPRGDAEKLAIVKVPTFVFFKNNIEVGRIIESPEKSMEKDILKILKN